MRTNTHTRKHTQRDTHTLTHRETHACTLTHALSHTHTHTHTHTPTHTRRERDTHTHTHTHRERLLTSTKKRDHITPVLRSLHWLPVRYRVNFKILLVVFKSLNGLAPAYLSDLLTEHRPLLSLRSSNQRLLSIPKSRLKCRGDRAFSVAAPSLWNALPLCIRSAPSISDFKSMLKTYLFDLAFYQ